MKKGDKFNRLTIIDDNYTRKDSNYRKFWKCQCECGKIVEVRQDHLKSGHTKSCGCENKRRINNIIGQRFNKLVVVEKTDKRRSHGDVVWKCRCDCGNYTYASASELRNNRIKSCGCMKSIGEYTVAKILTENNINFKQQYKFNDLKDEDFLRFDFGVLNNGELEYLIEYDGNFHFGDKTPWNGNFDQDKVIKHDKMKNNYCIKNNIPLIRIPYTILKTLNIEDLILSTSKYIID